MSWNQEHIAWREDDGTISVGFYPSFCYGYVEDGDDPEWDVTYYYDSFYAFFKGLSHERDVLRVAPEGNPGHVSMTDNPEEVAEARRLAKEFEDREAARAAEERAVMEVPRQIRDHVRTLGDKV